MSFRKTLIGSIYIALGQLLFATNDAIIKSSSLKECQLLFGRFGIQFSIAILWWIMRKPHDTTNWYGDKGNIMNIWIRGITFTINTICLWYGVIRLPLGDATTIYYQSPLVIAIFAWLFLGEKLPKLTPIICILAIIGIILISQPSFIISIYYRIFNKHNNHDIQPLNIDGLIAIFTSLFTWSISAVLVRAAVNAHFLQLEIVSGGQTLFISIPTLMVLNEYVFHNPFLGTLDISDWSFDLNAIIVMIVIGTFGFIALSLNVIGFQYGDATKVAWLEYIAIVFSFLYQIFVFKNIPNKLEIIGVGLVMIACILSLIEEVYIHFISKNRNAISYDPIHIISSGESTNYDTDPSTE